MDEVGYLILGTLIGSLYASSVFLIAGIIKRHNQSKLYGICTDPVINSLLMQKKIDIV